MADFLSQYLEYTKENEAPETFHFWSAIAMLGHVLNRRVWLDQWHYKVYPGQAMVCLVSDSAVSRKTTAINIAVELMLQLPPEDINMIEGKHSQATLMDALVRVDDFGNVLDSIGLIVADELGMFLTRETFAESMATDITALNTAREGITRRRMRSSHVELLNVCLGLLAGTTPTGLAHEIPKAAQTAGLLGRMVCVFADETDRVNPLTEKPADMSRVRTRLIAQLYRMKELSGEFVWTADGKSYYEDWYRHFKTTPVGTDERTGFYGRKHIHLLRTAMILQCARSSELVLSGAILHMARLAIEQVEMFMPDAHRKLGSGRFSEHQELIISTIGRAGGKVTHTKLANTIWRKCSGEDLKRALMGLIEAETIHATEGDRRGTLIYRVNQTRGDMLKNVKVEVSNRERTAASD